MMKKLAKATLLAAVAAFLLAGFPACSSDDDDDPTLTEIKIRVDDSTVKTTYTVGEDFDPAGITVTATYSDGSTEDVTDDVEFGATYNDEDFTTATAGTYEGVILTASYGGKTDSVTCTITVKAGGITTTGSWTLTGDAIAGKSFYGFLYWKKADSQYEAGAGTTIPEVKSAAAITIDTATTTDKVYFILSDGMELAGSDGNLSLELSNYAGTGVGGTKVGNSAALPTATNGTPLTSEPKAISYKAHSQSGLLIKKDALKIAGVKGSVKLTVNWLLASAKSANDRYLEVTVGDGETVKTGCSTEKEQDPYVVNIDADENGKDVYIGASNEVYIKSITIEAR